MGGAVRASLLALPKSGESSIRAALDIELDRTAICERRATSARLPASSVMLGPRQPADPDGMRSTSWR